MELCTDADTKKFFRTVPELDAATGSRNDYPPPGKLSSPNCDCS